MKTSHQILFGVAAAAIIAGIVRVNSGHRIGPSDIYPPSDIHGSLNVAITQANIGQTICNPKWSTKSIRPSSNYTTSLKKKQLVQEKLTGTLSDFEEDHLVSLELGGNPTDPQNLWPEAYNTRVNGVRMGAKEKDMVENFLHGMVCDGAISLAEAQRVIVVDWYSVYAQMTPQGRYSGSGSGSDD